MRAGRVLGLITVVSVLGGIGATSASADSSGGAGATGTTPATPATAAPAASVVSQTVAVALTRSQTKSVQRRIGVKADGVFGAKSRSALARYQARKKLKKTGKPDLETLRAMGLSFAAAIEQKLATKLTAPAASKAPVVATPVVATPVVPATGAAAVAIAAAQSQLGTPYLSAGESPGGFDCSGLVLWAYGQAGVPLPRTSFDQFGVGLPVDQAAIQPGDLVFFATDGPGASHVGIATSATTAISSTSHGVREHEIFDDYWGPAFVGARRVTG